jgi:hypothetical protein
LPILFGLKDGKGKGFFLIFQIDFVDFVCLGLFEAAFPIFTADMYKKKLLILLLLFVFSLLLHLYSANPYRVENYYAVGFYPKLAICFRFLTGWLPFSLGDILYLIAAIWLIWKLCSFIFRLIKRRLSAENFKYGIINTLTVLLSIYIVFNLFWGINYDRKGIAYQLGLDENKYSVTELKKLDSLLLLKVNESKLSLLHNNSPVITTKEIFNESVNAYKNIDSTFPFLQYNVRSVKSSMWGWLGNYLNFSGYYNPFTGEAQVNTTVPYFLIPYTTCHEMAHQLGYAKEDEANFVGYLAASASADTFFHYSVYLDNFLATNRNLFMVDSSSAKMLARQLLPEVKMDLKNWKKFIEDHKNPAEPVIQWLYGKYLEGNKQPSGVLTYDEVTGLLISYYKKFGKI